MKVGDGYDNRNTCEGPSSGFEGLAQSITAAQHSQGQWPVLSQQVRALMTSGSSEDQKTVLGCIVEPLTTQHFRTALERYGRLGNMCYELGVVCATETPLVFDPRITRMDHLRHKRTHQPRLGIPRPRITSIVCDSTRTYSYCQKLG